MNATHNHDSGEKRSRETTARSGPRTALSAANTPRRSDGFAADSDREGRGALRHRLW